MERYSSTRNGIPSSNTPLAIVCGADDNYITPLAVTLYSALTNLNAERDVFLYILDGGISSENKRKLLAAIEVGPGALRCQWLKPDLAQLRDLRTQRWLTTAAYLRLLMPDVLPAHLDKVIYLDSDLIVEGDLNQLWVQETGGNVVLAVQAFGIPYAATQPLGIAKYQDLGLEPDTPYFNSGVMLVNLRQWRAEQVSQEALRYLREYRIHLRCHDQEALNVVLARRWGMLHPKWNVMSNIYSFVKWPDSPFKQEIAKIYEELISNPYIVHFSGQSKPWKFNGLHPAYGCFFMYLRAVKEKIQSPLVQVSADH